MADTHVDQVAHIGEALTSVRAAIDVVASGAARRVVVHAVTGEQVLSAARALAHASGVEVEPIWSMDESGVDLVVRPRAAER